ncbi:hypothetical protein GCM10027613_16000 [Microlunatus endophyticus]
MAELNLVPIGRLTGGFRSEVMSARTPDGQEVVVKAPPTITEAVAEAGALNLWRNTGAAVPVLHFDDQQGVLVLERLRPGLPLVLRVINSFTVWDDGVCHQLCSRSVPRIG